MLCETWSWGVELGVITVRCGGMMQDVGHVKCGAMLCKMWCARCGDAINVANIWCDLKLMWRYVVHQ